MTIFELVNTKGPAVLGPLKRMQTNEDVFYAAFDGSPLLYNGEWGAKSAFKTEAEALAFAQRFAKEAPQAQKPAKKRRTLKGKK